MRAFAGALLVMAAVVTAADLYPLATGTPWSDLSFVAVGEVWFRIHPDSYQLLEPAISRHVSPLLWDYVVLPLMTAPVALVLGLLGALAWLASRRREGDGGRRRRRRHDFRRR